MYSPETGGVLNYLTLCVSDPEVRKEVHAHRAKEFNKLFWPFNLLSLFNFLQQIITFTSQKRKTELFFLVNSIFKLVFMGPVWFIMKNRLKNFSPLLIIPHFLYYAIMDALAFKEQSFEFRIGELLCVMDKNHLRTSLLVTFTVTACINYNPY